MKQRLGLLDWGIGGVSIHKLIKARAGNVPVIYFSDTGVNPYGRMSSRELVARVNKVTAFLKSRGVSHVVIGCNAASTVIPFLDVAGLQVEGVIESAVHLTARMRPKRLALIGGKRTVLSGIYRRRFGALGIHVAQRIAQPLSAVIEAGDVSSPELREHCRKILRPIHDCSHLLLACTHYPAIKALLSEFVSDNTILIDPIGELVKKITHWNLQSSGTDLFFTSGDPDKMKLAARNAFGFRINKASRIELSAE